MEPKVTARPSSEFRVLIRDVAIVGLCAGTADFLAVYWGSKLFLSGGVWFGLWVGIVGCSVLGLLCVLSVIHRFASPQRWILVGLSVALVAWFGERTMRDAPPFTDGSVAQVTPLGAEAVSSATPGTPNVLVVSVDTLRNDHVGGDLTRTPHLDELAANGVRIEAAYAPIAVTGPSHAAMLTGAGPWTTGMLLNGVPIPDGFESLATALGATGRRTAAFVSAVVLDPVLGFDRGFEVYDHATGFLPGFELSTPGRIAAMAVRRADPHGVLERRGDATTDQAIRWLETVGEEPFFAWVHLFDPHGPYAPPPPHDTAHYTGDPRSTEHRSMEEVSGVADYLLPSLEGIRDVDWVRAQYAGEVDFVDEQVGRLIKTLKTSGRLDDTLVVFVGDHGESLGENGVWFNHGGDLDESALRVPMIFHWPAGLPNGTVVPPLASVTDVSPTVRGLLGMDTAAADGVNVFGEAARPGVLAVCYDRGVNQRERAAGRIERPTHVMGRVWGTSGWLERATHESRQPRLVGEMPKEDEVRLDRAMAAIGGSVHRGNQNRGADTVERLKALGYVE